ELVRERVGAGRLRGIGRDEEARGDAAAQRAHGGIAERRDHEEGEGALDREQASSGQRPAPADAADQRGARDVAHRRVARAIGGLHVPSSAASAAAVPARRISRQPASRARSTVPVHSSMNVFFTSSASAQARSGKVRWTQAGKWPPKKRTFARTSTGPGAPAARAPATKASPTGAQRARSIVPVPTLRSGFFSGSSGGASGPPRRWL